MDIPNRPELGFFEWLEAMRSHSCSNCEYGDMMLNLREPRIPVACAECYAGYSAERMRQDAH